MLKTVLFCLALNVYHESRGEPELGQLAVAHVTLNRAKQNNSTVCTEVFKKNQFSWTRNKFKIPRKDDPEWKTSMQIAKLSLTKTDITKGSLYFAERRVFFRKKKTLQIGNHNFFK